MLYFDKIAPFASTYEEAKGYIYYTDRNANISKATNGQPYKNSALRIKGVKKYVLGQFKNESYISTEPKSFASCLYLNVPDYSLSTKDEQSKGIYHAYNQYILDLSYWYERGSDVKFGKVTPKIVYDEETSTYLLAFSNLDVTIPSGYLDEDSDYINLGGDEVDAKVRADTEKLLSGEHDIYAEVVIPYSYYNDIETRDLVIGYFTADDIINRRDAVVQMKYNFVKGRYIDMAYDSLDYAYCTENEDDNNYSKTTSKWYMSDRYVPLMPTKLWYRVPYGAKKEVGMTTLWQYARYHVVVKRSTFFGKMFKIVVFVIAVIITVLSYGSGAIAAWQMVASIAILTATTFFSKQLGAKMTMILQIIGAALSAYNVIAKAKQAGEFGLKEAIALGKSGYSAYSSYSNYQKYRAALKEANKKDDTTDDTDIGVDLDLSSGDDMMDGTYMQDYWYYVAVGERDRDALEHYAETASDLNTDNMFDRFKDYSLVKF